MGTQTMLVAFCIGLLGIASASKIGSVATGRSFSFVINHGASFGDGGALQATGRNHWGQLGLGDRRDREVLSEVRRPDWYENATVKAVAAGAFHSLLLLDSGEVFSTGRNHQGQLGVRSMGLKPGSPGWIKLDLPPVRAVAAGYAHSVFLLEDGAVMVAGANSAGQLGLGHTETTRKPEQMLGGYQATSVAAGYDFTYVLIVGGDVYATGQNLGGQLGVGDRKTRTTLSRVERQPETVHKRMPAVAQMAAGDSHGHFLDVEGHLWSVGANFNGQTGNGACNLENWVTDEINFYPTIREVPQWRFNNIKSVTAGGDSSCISNWQLLCFGSNMDGQLGLGDAGGDSKCAAKNVYIDPTPVHGLDFVDSMSVSDAHSFFVNHGTSLDEVYVTGSDDFGELGRGENRTKLYEPQVLVDLGEREERTTTVAPPTPRPTPAPTPGTTPAGPTRAPNDGDDDGAPSSWPFYLMSWGVTVAILVLLWVLSSSSGDQTQADPAEGDQPVDLEMIRGQMSMN